MNGVWINSVSHLLNSLADALFPLRDLDIFTSVSVTTTVTQSTEKVAELSRSKRQDLRPPYWSLLWLLRATIFIGSKPLAGNVPRDGAPAPETSFSIVFDKPPSNFSCLVFFFYVNICNQERILVAHFLLVLRVYFGPLKTVTIPVTFPRWHDASTYKLNIKTRNFIPDITITN